MIEWILQPSNYNYTAQGWLTFFVGILVLILAAVSVARSDRSHNSFLFCLLNTIIGIWLMTYALSLWSNNEVTAFIWLNLSFLFVPLILPLAYLFISSFLEPTKKRKIIRLLFFIIGIFFVISQVYFHAIFEETNHFSWGYYAKYKLNLFLAFYLSSFFFIVLYSLYELIIAYKNTPKGNQLKRNRLKVLILSMLTGYMASVDYIPGFGFDIIPVGIFFLFLFVICFFYAIEKYNLLNITALVANKIIQTMNDALIVCDNSGYIHSVNHSFEKLSQLMANQLINLKVDDIICLPKDTDNSLNIIQHLKISDVLGSFEATLKKKNNELIPISVSFSYTGNTKSKTKGWIIIAHDISEYKKSINKLLYLSNHDYLTNIYNRKHFENKLVTHIEQCKKNNYKSALFLFDIDHFKEINDSFGHQFGDKLLINFSILLKEYLREPDVLSRIGGDEFAAIITNIKLSKIDSIANNILKLINENQFNINGHEIFISSSIGISIIPDHGSNYEALITNADLALYHCKLKQRNSYIVYSDKKNWNNLFKNKLLVATRIKDAIKHDKLVLYAQPIFNLKTNKITHYELLIRIKNESGLILPDNFLDVAEHYSLMNEINLFVISKTIDLITQFKHITFCCNLSANAFNDYQLLNLLKQSINKVDFEPERMIIEITEHTVATHIDSATHFINNCKSLGINFALDDFGVGLSSFSHLRNMPVNYLKLDGSFIENIYNNKIDQQFVISMVDISRALNIKTIAEYVGDSLTEKILREFGIDYTQGNYYGKPDKLSKWDGFE